MKTYWQNDIDGTWVDGGAGRINVFNLGTGEKLAEQALADVADVDRVTTAACQLRAGQVFVNEWDAGGVETPFGGYGKSGYGREKKAVKPSGTMCRPRTSRSRLDERAENDRINLKG